MSTSENDAVDNDGRAVDWVPDGIDPAELATRIERFWHTARAHMGLGDTSFVTGTDWADAVVPPAWAFGDNEALANDLLTLVLDGTKTGTASAQWEYGDNDPLPEVGEVSIILDGTGEPAAVIRTTTVEVVPFDQVTADHAYSEGEGDRTLDSWRRDHESFWRRTLPTCIPPHEFAADMPVVCERFELLYPK
jgi:uncharacterized protein YhfF